jgi:Flp pilus assembly CpaE family ATPase
MKSLLSSYQNFYELSWTVIVALLVSLKSYFNLIIFNFLIMQFSYITETSISKFL